ncbi:rod-binding protein [Endozoicomonas ascidiicola]|uniref:rod-binding protein n=1 Tax=Endozoicomonas ascidiicola TaxID=1698521 RepID=UPI000830B566|nr:rod-binding protein [Endozoicomonas ascidiicola]
MKIDSPDPRLMAPDMRTGISASTVKPNNGKLEQAATDFEAMFFQQMLKSMRQANDVLAEDNPFNSKEQSFMHDWHDSELAISMAESGGIGLADQLIQQVEALQGK